MTRDAATGGPIEVRCLHDLSEAEPLRDALNALNLASARPDPFSTFEFYDFFQRDAQRRPGSEAGRLWLLLAFAGGQLVGYLALKRRVSRVLGLRAAKLDLLTAFVADRPHLVARPGLAEAVSAAFYAYLLGRKEEWSLLEFQQQEADSPLLLAPPEAATGGCRSRLWPSSENGTVAVRWDSLAAYVAALSGKFRSNVSRQMRTLLAAGDVQVLTSSDPGVVAPLFELYRGIEARGWKARTEAAFGHDRRWIDYFTGLMDPAQPMRMTIQVLLLDGLPVAGLISGAFDRGLYALHMAYDDRFAHLAPGSAMLLMGMRLAIEGRHDSFNLLRGSGYYKSRWLAQLTETRSLQIYRTGTPYFWRRALGDGWRRWFGKAGTLGGNDRFNPARRGIARPAPGGAAPLPDAQRQERERCAGLVARVRSGHAEFLSASQLAAVLPFETRRPDPAGPAHGKPGRTVSRPAGPFEPGPVALPNIGVAGSSRKTGL